MSAISDHVSSVIDQSMSQQACDRSSVDYKHLLACFGRVGWNSSSSTMKLGVVALGCLCLLAVVSAEVLFEEKFDGEQLLRSERQASQHF